MSTVVINAADVARSVDFYTAHLQAQPQGPVTGEHAVLDLVTATLELVRVGPDAPASSWVIDNLQRGFRHVGFKVDHVDPFVEGLRAAGILLQLAPLEAEWDVRITFFRDPDGFTIATEVEQR
jgi:catechol 2,3-dioxygenase-like lactoylglutathione lyase family enzyme